MSDRYCEHGMFKGLRCPECLGIERNEELVDKYGGETRELEARVNYLEGILRLIADNERFNNGVTASSIAREALDPNDCDF